MKLRIFWTVGGANPKVGGAPTYDFAKFNNLVHKTAWNLEFFGPYGGAPFRSATGGARQGALVFTGVHRCTRIIVILVGDGRTL